MKDGIWRLLRRIDDYARVTAAVVEFIIGIFLCPLAIFAAIVLGVSPWTYSALVYPILVAVGFFFPAWCAVRAGGASGIIGHIGWRAPMYVAMVGWSVLFFWFVRDMATIFGAIAR